MEIHESHMEELQDWALNVRQLLIARYFFFLSKIKILISYISLFYKYRKTDRQTQEQILRVNRGTSETIFDVT